MVELTASIFHKSWLMPPSCLMVVAGLIGGRSRPYIGAGKVELDICCQQGNLCGLLGLELAVLSAAAMLLGQVESSLFCCLRLSVLS